MFHPKSIAIVGSGPAALLAADIISQKGHLVSVFEKKRGPGRKLLIAGSSGLNITNHLSLNEFISNYTGPQELWKKLLTAFSPQAWIQFIEDLGISTFKGTSGRYFVQDMKSSKFLKAWMNRLSDQKVQFFYDHEFQQFSYINDLDLISLHFLNKNSKNFDAVCLCLGGGSYEPNEKPLRWPFSFAQKNIQFIPFSPSNVGYQIAWNEGLLKEAEGLPIKNIRLTSSRGSRLGDLVITRYGLEGTPVYSIGEKGILKLDLKPDLSLKQILDKCDQVKENLSPLRKIKKQLALCPAALALLFHMSPPSVLKDIKQLASTIKNFPILFENSQGLDESISSSGGIDFSELDDDFMLKKYPGVFLAGEMINWDAPTGGFLIQGCVSQGFHVGKSIIKFLDS